MIDLVDMHMHAGFAADPETFANELASIGVAAFANTVTPLEYLQLSTKIINQDIRLGVGLHPWWVGTEELGGVPEALMLFEDGIETTRFVGEIGLDLWPSHEHSASEQLNAFKYAIALCTQMSGKVISIHCVKAEEQMLEVLENTGCLNACACILHSYGGSSDHLQRAIKDGCLFSIGLRMLKSKRGREYARIIPQDRLLLESDLPNKPGDATSVIEIKNCLDEVLDDLASIRGLERALLKEEITSRSLQLLEL